MRTIYYFKIILKKYIIRIGFFGEKLALLAIYYEKIATIVANHIDWAPLKKMADRVALSYSLLLEMRNCFLSLLGN